MIVSIIVAASTNNIIGKNNQLLWHLPRDLAYFKNKTWAMPVIMGRKTYESVGSKPLPGRFNFVVTSQTNWDPKNQKVGVASSLEAAVELSKGTDCKEVFILGGGQLYKTSMALADKIFMTRVHAVLQGDTSFPEINEKEWQLSSNTDFPADGKNGYEYSFQVWLKK